MEAAALFVVGQALIGVAAYVLSKALPWPTVVGSVLLVEGAICVVACFVTSRSSPESGKPWHDGAA